MRFVHLSMEDWITAKVALKAYASQKPESLIKYKSELSLAGRRLYEEVQMLPVRALFGLGRVIRPVARFFRIPWRERYTEAYRVWRNDY
jgi:hypothetical protein